MHKYTFLLQAMVNVAAELVTNANPNGTYAEQQGHSRGKWTLKLAHGMTPNTAIKKLKRCPKFKAKYPESPEGYFIEWSQKRWSKDDPGINVLMDEAIDHTTYYHELLVNEPSFGRPSVDSSSLGRADRIVYVRPNAVNIIQQIEHLMFPQDRPRGSHAR